MNSILYLPTYGRPSSLKAFAENYVKTEAEIEIAVFLEEIDPELKNYLKLELPPTFKLVICPDEGKIGAAIHLNQFFDLYGGAPVIGFVADDVFPTTLHWDQIMVSNAFAYGFAQPHDSNSGYDFAPHFFLATSFVKKVGSLNPLNFSHFGIDNFWFHLAQETGRIKQVPVYFKHDRLEDESKTRVRNHVGSKDVVKWKEFSKLSNWREFVKCCK